MFQGGRLFVISSDRREQVTFAFSSAVGSKTTEKCLVARTSTSTDEAELLTYVHYPIRNARDDI